MAQFKFTPEEITLVIDAVRSKAGQYTSMYGVADPALEALVSKITSAPAPEEPVAVSNAAAEAAFLDGVPHEQHTEE
jgi:hypothetical protein